MPVVFAWAKKPPLCKGGTDRRRWSGGIERSGGIMLLGFMIGCGSTAWVQRHAANPSVGVRRQLPLHKGALFAFLQPTCPARQRSMTAQALGRCYDLIVIPLPFLVKGAFRPWGCALCPTFCTPCVLSSPLCPVFGRWRENKRRFVIFLTVLGPVLPCIDPFLPSILTFFPSSPEFCAICTCAGRKNMRYSCLLFFNSIY